LQIACRVPRAIDRPKAAALRVRTLKGSPGALARQSALAELYVQVGRIDEAERYAAQAVNRWVDDRVSFSTKLARRRAAQGRVQRRRA
jgi:predicted Zn-dependent protease